MYLVQDTGTEFCHEKTQYNDVNKGRQVDNEATDFIQRETLDCRKELSFFFSVVLYNCSSTSVTLEVTSA